MTCEHYLNNKMIHASRQLKNHQSKWVQQFDCSDVKPLIICRGPIRKEAMDVFNEMGIGHYGMLLSEKDAIVYRNALAPERRLLTDSLRVHCVEDYSGVDKQQRQSRIQEIIQIAKKHDYNAIFAGYGFMAEDQEMVAAMESAGLNFIGPCSRTVHDAGLKDEAKRTALREGVSVTPGIDNASTLALLKKHPTKKHLIALNKKQQLGLDQTFLSDSKNSIESKAEAVLEAGYAKGIDLYSTVELCECIEQSVTEMFKTYPQNRIRLKAISGGGGKGQRIMAAPSSYEGNAQQQLELAVAQTSDLVREIHNEVKTTGVGDNKNLLVELNIETTRHQEIQVIGNGDWAVSLGGRDCSLQMHEQKLLELSVTEGSLVQEIAQLEQASKKLKKNKNKELKSLFDVKINTLKQSLSTLIQMEKQAEDFAVAVGLDSVSTFECIVDRNTHFFMEMNTRIQVEHRVSELCYGLEFSHPDNASDRFVVNSLVEAMVLLARHGKQLPKPVRVNRYNDALEARLNATNDALQPHAGGCIEYWSDAQDFEIRDDQGISLHNPDSDQFMRYHLAGAYDSNIALLLTVGDNRQNTFEKLAEVIRKTEIQGDNLATNLQFHYGLLHWFLANEVLAQPTTGFMVPYLTLVGELAQPCQQFDLNLAYKALAEKSLAVHNAESDEFKAQLMSTITSTKTLFLRPLQLLLNNPHKLSGWLSRFKNAFDCSNTMISWQQSPYEVIASSYEYLNMEASKQSAAVEKIWSHDQQILGDALDFYQQLSVELNSKNWIDLTKKLTASDLTKYFTPDMAEQVLASHCGFMSAIDICLTLPWIAQQQGFYDLSVNADLSITPPERLLEKTHQKAMLKRLAPATIVSSNEILAVSGGMFYPRETPDSEPFLAVGSHFEKGQVMYIVEVMKMFNKVNAPFAGTVTEVLLETDGSIISKGQPLFKIEPDEVIVIDSEHGNAQEKQRFTNQFIATQA